VWDCSLVGYPEVIGSTPVRPCLFLFFGSAVVVFCLDVRISYG